MKSFHSLARLTQKTSSFLNQKITSSFSSFFTPYSPAFSLASSSPSIPSERQSQSLNDLFDSLWFAAPKSKVSPSRKRMKHLQHVPKPVQWITCAHCGEPKRPHRVCSKDPVLCATPVNKMKANKPSDL